MKMMYVVCRDGSAGGGDGVETVHVERQFYDE